MPYIKVTTNASGVDAALAEAEKVLEQQLG